MRVGVTFDMSDLERGVASAIRDDMPFVAVLGLTELAKDVRDDLKGDIAVAFESPRPFTINSPAARPAQKRDKPPRSEEYIRSGGNTRTPAGKYLLPQVLGGARRDKGLEVALQTKGLIGRSEQMVPATGLRLNRFGNVTGAFVRRVLAELGAGGRSRYFWSNGSGRLPKGIAERRPRGRVRMIFVAVDDASYRPRFDMAARVAFHANRKATPAFRRASQRVFSRRRRR